MMMMMGEADGPHSLVPPWTSVLDEASSGYPLSGIADADSVAPYLLASLRNYMPTTEEEEEAEAAAAAVDAYACDEFRMYEFKVRRCARGRSHDWTECPFAHPGEKARRRDPRKFHYSGTACPDFRKSGCRRGDACEFAHGVFECWMHPARYRTQPCKDGTSCRRRVCFFAHTPEQLRVLPPQQLPSPRGSPCADSYDGSPLRRQAFESYLTKSLISSSPTSTLISPPRSPPSESPPLSPVGGSMIRRGNWSGAAGSPVNDVVASLRQLRLSKAKSAPSGGWTYPAAGFGSPKGPVGFCGGMGFMSLPSTPTRPMAAGEGRDLAFIEEDGPAERVESGRALREKVFERLSREGLAAGGAAGARTPAPDVDWVSDLVG